ncbi:hypothetical protein [Nocardia sp. alder85J]|uniref:hypothetical protein n=1 Tax=Nocardia sp. alder85J TaxID=2862949 RepID=UPI001CD3081F|nr:hypothetical protein [Nocardia sp. alder85J]MCX4097527.1 hypothetical protein [Nocardia sp. alder85J]
MSHRAIRGVSRAMVIGALPLAVALEMSGVAGAAPVAAQPEPVVQSVSQGVPLEIATDPSAHDSDPLHNGIAGGALAGAAGSGILGAATGSGIGAIPGAINGAVWGTIIGALVGVFAPDAVPQVLP